MSLPEERLDEIRAKLDEQDFDWDYPFDVAAEDLLTEVDRLTAALADMTRQRDDLSNSLADARSWEPEAERLRARYNALRAEIVAAVTNPHERTEPAP